MVQRFVWNHAWQFPSKAPAGLEPGPLFLLLGPAGASQGLMPRAIQRDQAQAVTREGSQCVGPLWRQQGETERPAPSDRKEREKRG